MSRVTIVDYGAGNLFSVRRALEKCGAEPLFTDSPALIAAAERLILPGVGAFADGMAGLRERGLIEPVRQFAASRRPLLGICLGMQMLLSSSEEFGQHEGLGLIAGRVLAIPSTGIDGAPHKIPHIGWAGLEASQGAAWDGSILRDVRPGSTVYMVHSYTAVPDDLTHRLADCRYDGRLISAAIRAGEVYGCQFHPEKSGPVGLRILATFLEA